MPKFVLFAIDQRADFEGLSPDEIQAIIQRYVDWTNRLRARGHLLDSNKLRDGTGHSMRREEGRTVVRDGPFTETKEVIGGYWVLRAPSYDDAVGLAGDCPHLDFGTLVIREVEEL